MPAEAAIGLARQRPARSAERKEAHALHGEVRASFFLGRIALPPHDDAPERLQQDQLRYDLAIGKMRDVADNILKRLRKLNEQFPSQELGEAIQRITEWRDQRGG